MSHIPRPPNFKTRLRLVQLIESVEERLNPVLFSPTSLVAIKTLATQIPLLDVLLLELRLSSADSSVDLSFPLSATFCSDGNHSPIWNRIVTLQQACQLDEEFAGAIGSNVFWGEFDYESMLSPTPVPGIFFDVNLMLTQSRYKPLLVQILCRAWEILMGKAIPYSTSQGLETALMALPESVCCTHAGIMLSRLLKETILSNSLRLNFSRWQLKELVNWLTVIGLGTIATEVEQVTQEIPHLLEHLILTVEIAESVGYRVGLECHPTTLSAVTSHTNSRDWLTEFSDWLRSKNLVDDSKILALLDWKQEQKFSFNPSLESDMSFPYSEYRLDLSHLKLVFEPTRGMQVKAYLLINFLKPEDKIQTSKSFERIWNHTLSTRLNHTS